MQYDIDQLIKALLNETMAEIAEDLAEIHNLGRQFNDVEEFANNIFHQLRGLHPESPEAEQAVSRMYSELDRFSFYPKSHELLTALVKVAGEKYKEDPGNYIKIVVMALNSESANQWYSEYRGGRR